jgi:DNA topoisomerase IA
MLKLTSITKKKEDDFVPGTVKATYDVVHDSDRFKLKLTQNLEVTICERTGEVRGELHITELMAPSMPEALAKLAIWCERMALALREPMKVTASVPIYERDYAKEETSRKFEQGGLVRVRLQALANGKGISSADAIRAAQKLFDEGYISYPIVDVAYLPGNRDWAVCGILENIEVVFPGISKDAIPRQDAPVFLHPFPYGHHAIVPTEERPRDAENFLELSEAERTVYQIVAEEFVRAICEPPGGEPAKGKVDE